MDERKIETRWMISPATLGAKLGISHDAVLARVREGRITPDVLLEQFGGRSCIGFDPARVPEISALLARQTETVL